MPISIRDAFLSLALQVLRLKSSTVPVSESGLIILQIDGLAYEILREARGSGICPFIDSLIIKQKYTIGKYFSGIPSSTVIVDAELFYGTHEGIVSFTWIDRKSKQFRFGVNNISIRSVEDELKKTYEPLMTGGSSLMFAYGAGAKVLDLSSAELDLHHIPELIPKYRGIFVPLLNPIRFWKIFLVFLFHMVTSVLKSLVTWNFWYYRHTMIELLMKIFLNDYASVLARIEIWRGTPRICLNFCLYDHIAHLHGPRHPLSLQALKLVDFYIRELYLSMVRSKRKYSFIIMSDHGQIDAKLFRNITGEPVDRLIFRAIGDGAYSVAVKRVGARFSERDVQVHVENNQDVHILVCGDTAQIYFTEFLDTPLTKELIDKKFPKFFNTVLSHPGVGWILVRSKESGATLISRSGTVLFEKGKVKNVSRHMENLPEKRILDDIASYSLSYNVGDIVIFGAVVDGKAACFEEHEPHGAHGGFNGEEPCPFLVSNDPSVINMFEKGEPSKEALFQRVRALVL